MVTFVNTTSSNYYKALLKNIFKTVEVLDDLWEFL